jgi:hypothetical protein
MPATTPHRCNSFCVCPIHGTPLIYWPAGHDHACQADDCRYREGGCSPVLAWAWRVHRKMASREHGHADLVDGCALCNAEYDEARAYAQS